MGAAQGVRQSYLHWIFWFHQFIFYFLLQTSLPYKCYPEPSPPSNVVFFFNRRDFSCGRSARRPTRVNPLSIWVLIMLLFAFWRQTYRITLTIWLTLTLVCCSLCLLLLYNPVLGVVFSVDVCVCVWPVDLFTAGSATAVGAAQGVRQGVGPRPGWRNFSNPRGVHLLYIYIYLNICLLHNSYLYMYFFMYI